MSNLTTVVFGKNESVELSADIVQAIVTSSRATTRADVAYIAKNEVLVKAVAELAIWCADNNVSRTKGGVILAAIANVDYLKNDRSLANAWQHVAKELPTDRELNETKKLAGMSDEDKAKVAEADALKEAEKEKGEARKEAIATINETGLSVALAVQSNQTKALGGLLVDILSADQLDVLAKIVNDHIATRKTIKPKTVRVA